MARRSDFDIIRKFVDSRNPNESEVQEALGLGRVETMVFYEGLNSIEKDSKLTIINFTSIARTIVGFPSVYINKVKKAGLIKRGNKLGDWKVTRDAIRIISMLIINGSEAKNEPEVQKTEAPRREDENPLFDMLNLAGVTAKTTLGELKEMIEEVDRKHDEEIEELYKKVDQIREVQTSHRNFLKRLGL